MQSKGEGAAALQSTFGQISPQLIAAINSLYVYACTGQGKQAMRENAAAKTCIRLALRDRDYLFTEQERSKLDNMIEMSEVEHSSPTSLLMAPCRHALWAFRCLFWHPGMQVTCSSEPVPW